MKQILTYLLVLTNVFLAHAVENIESSTTIAALGEPLTTPIQWMNFGIKPQEAQASDSLIFVNAKRNQRVAVAEGRILDVVTNKKEKISGELISASKDSFELKQGEKIITIAVADIKQVMIHPHSNVMTGILGIAVGAASATSLTLGGAAMIGGLFALDKSVLLGAGLITVSVPLIYYGVKLLIRLKKADRRKIKLNKGWKVETVEAEP